MVLQNIKYIPCSRLLEQMQANMDMKWLQYVTTASTNTLTILRVDWLWEKWQIMDFDYWEQF
jgi:hypothetical protein